MASEIDKESAVLLSRAKDLETKAANLKEISSSLTILNKKGITDTEIADALKKSTSTPLPVNPREEKQVSSPVVKQETSSVTQIQKDSKTPQEPEKMSPGYKALFAIFGFIIVWLSASLLIYIMFMKGSTQGNAFGWSLLYGLLVFGSVLGAAMFIKFVL